MSTPVNSGWGAPVPDDRNSLTVGPNGPLVMDVHYFDKISHFDRERIPERVVHANGVAAHGHFEVTNDISRYCKAALFSKVGNKVKSFVRFSNVSGERGAADTERDARGFAIKFYTEEGNWDLVCNNAPVFFIRDPMLFPDVIHAQKRNPKTDLRDPSDFWSFMANSPESVHLLLMLYGDRGVPASYRHMNGYGNHSFRLVNAEGKGTYCKFHVKAEGGVKSLTSEAAEAVRGADTDYLKRDLYDYIGAGGKAIYNMFVQLIPEEDVAGLPYNIFDVTKVVPHGDYPLIQVGRLVLDSMPENFFQETEMSAFCPGNLVPGIEPSADRILQGRLISYSDTQRHRLGPNFHELPINRAVCPMFNHQRDGFMRFDNRGSAPSFYPGTSTEPSQSSKDRLLGDGLYVAGGPLGRYDQAPKNPDDDFVQPRALYERVMTEEERDRLVRNIMGHLQLANPMIQEKMIALFARVCDDLGRRLLDLQRQSMAGEVKLIAAKEPSSKLPGLHEKQLKHGNFVVDAPPRYAEQSEISVNSPPDSRKFAYGKDAAGPKLLGAMTAAAKNTVGTVMSTVKSTFVHSD